MIEKIFEILTTLTEESQQAALMKCTELGYPLDRGLVPLGESYLNLSWAREILIDSIEKRKLIQLPITIQKSLIASLEAVAKHHNGLVSGADEVVNLSNAIENLTTLIWQYGLQNLSDQVLGYQTKINQLKQLEIQATEAKRELEAGLQKRTSLEQLLAEAEKKNEALAAFVASASEANTKANSSLSQITDNENKSSALLATIQQRDTTSTQQLASSTTSNAEILATENRIKQFFSEIDKYKTSIDSTGQHAAKVVSINEQETASLVQRLKGLEDQIKDQLQKATGFSLFHSFQTRQGNLATSRDFWSKALLLAVLVSIGLTIYIASTTTNVGIGFFLKLSLSLPMIFAIAFCAVQYSRERKLEEEYAFKSNISISLEPYKNLVEKLVDATQPEERQRYAGFVIDSIQKVFTSPTEKIFKDNTSSLGLTDKASLKQVTELVEAIGKIGK